MSSLYDFLNTELSSSATGGVNTAEGQDPSTVNDGLRQFKQLVAAFIDDLGAVTTVGGTADAITVTLGQVGGANSISAYATGQLFRFKAGADNTGAATLNVNAIGAKAIRKISSGADAALAAGDILNGKYYLAIYDATANTAAGAWIIDPGSTTSAATTSAAGILKLATLARTLAGTVTDEAVPPAYLYFPTGHLYGLTLSNNGTDAVNDIDIAAGTARDGSDTVNMLLASALTKKLDASWAVGTNQGMLDGSESSAGTPDTSTWYHIWLIKRSDTGVVDVLASESATAPTMPSNYDYKRRIGSVYNNSSGDIRAFTQNGDEFLWKTWVGDLAGSSMGTSQATRTLSVPTGIVVDALINVGAGGNSGEDSRGALYSPDETDPTLSNNYNYGVLAYATTSGQGQNWYRHRVRTNTSAQIRSKNSASSASIQLWLVTRGWYDTRGR